MGAKDVIAYPVLTEDFLQPTTTPAIVNTPSLNLPTSSCPTTSLYPATSLYPTLSASVEPAHQPVGVLMEVDGGVSFL